MRHMVVDATGKVLNVVEVLPADINRVGGWPAPAGTTVTPSVTANLGDHFDGVSLWRAVPLGQVGAVAPGTATAAVQAALPGAPAILQVAP